MLTWAMILDTTCGAEEKNLAKNEEKPITY